jgi:putative membrane protein
MNTYRVKILVWLLVFFSVFTWSGIQPKDYFTWFLEVLPAIIALALIALSYKSFPLTPLLYCLILAHAIVLMIGGHYTYAEVPFFDGLFGAERNNYDKVGHFFQGFVPAIVAREILIRKKVVKSEAWLILFVLSICLAFSAFYELIEWFVAITSGQGSEAFLGTQGYIWDTQSDMLYALIGASVALLTLRNVHNRGLKQLSEQSRTLE